MNESSTLGQLGRSIDADDNIAEYWFSYLKKRDDTFQILTDLGCDEQSELCLLDEHDVQRIVACLPKVIATTCIPEHEQTSCCTGEGS